MKTSRAAARAAQAIERLEAKVDRILALLGEKPTAASDFVDTIVENLTAPTADEAPAPRRGKNK